MIHREDCGPVAILRMEYGKANAMDIVFLEGLRQEIEDVHHANKAVVLTGTGKIFSGGIDLKKLLDGGRDYTFELVDALEALLEMFVQLPVPSVAAINGHAIAGGFVVASACDARILADGSGKLGLTELLVGVPFPPLALEWVRSAVGHRRARQMILSGKLYSAPEAADMGLVDELVAPMEVVERAVEIATRLAGVPRRTFELTKNQMLAPLRLRHQGPGDDLGNATRQQWAASETVEIIRRFVGERLG